MNGMEESLDQALATARGAVKLILLYGSPFILLGAISLAKIRIYGPFTHFSFGQASTGFLNTAATNLAVFLLCVAGFVTVIACVIWRYFHHRKTLAELRRRGISDLDGDGRTDGFADKFLDEL